MKTLLIVSICLFSFPILAQSRLTTTPPAPTHGEKVNQAVTKTIGDYYIQTLDLQLTIIEKTDIITQLQTELAKCHKDGCKDKK